MFKCIFCLIIGFVIGVVGLGGIVKMSDKAIGNANQFVKDQSK